MATFDEVVVTDFLDVRGNTKLGNATIDVTTITGDTNIGRDLAVTGNFNVSGSTTLGNASVDVTTITGDTNVGRNLAVNGNVTVNGATTLGNTAGDTVNTSGTLSAAGDVIAGTDVTAGNNVTAASRVIVTDKPTQSSPFITTLNVHLDATGVVNQPGLVLKSTGNVSYVIYIDDTTIPGVPAIVIQTAF